MGLSALVGGGMPPFDSTAISSGAEGSTISPIAVGSRAVDSSGGEYVLCRIASTASAVGTLHTLNSSIGYFHAVVVPASTAATGSALGAKMAAAGGTTNSFGWFQVYGPGVVLGVSTTGAAGTRLFGSTATAGAVLDSSGGLPIDGLQTVSSNASSLWNVFFSNPILTLPI